MHAGPGKSRRLSARRLLSGTRGRSILGTRRGLVLVVMALAVLGASISTARVAYAQPQNSFWWGSDSFQPSAASGSPPIPEPYNPSSWYQGYIAEVETYWTVLGCGAGRAVNSGNVTQANADWNYSTSIGVRDPQPLGTALYFFMGGPAADPSYNGTTSEAYNWGQRQAEAATNTYNSSGPSIETELMFMDIEGLDNEGIYGTGWNDVVQPCNNNHIVSYGIAYSVDRAAFNGFWDYIQNDTIFYPGVYSSPDMWNNTFGTGSYGSIPGTFEWTYENDTGSTNAPSNFWALLSFPWVT